MFWIVLKIISDNDASHCGYTEGADFCRFSWSSPDGEDTLIWLSAFMLVISVRMWASRSCSVFRTVETSHKKTPQSHTPRPNLGNGLETTSRPLLLRWGASGSVFSKQRLMPLYCELLPRSFGIKRPRGLDELAS